MVKIFLAKLEIPSSLDDLYYYYQFLGILPFYFIFALFLYAIR
jgi:hypothetical protein